MDEGVIAPITESPLPVGSRTPFIFTQHKEQLIQQSGLPLFEQSRLGQTFIAFDPTARAGVVAVPTTTAVSSLMNNNPTGSKLCFLVKRITSYVVANTAAASFTPVLNLQKLVASSSTDVARTVFPGGHANGSVGNIIINGATAVDADGWVPAGGNGAGANVASGFGTPYDSGDLEGLWIIRPQRILHAALVASATNVTGRIYFHCIARYVDNLVG